jgi:hypothetical protein
MGQPRIETPELVADAFFEPGIGPGVALDLVIAADLDVHDASTLYS